MLRIKPSDEIDEKAMFSSLMKRRHTATRFRLPYTEKQVLAMLTAACKAEVAYRHRQYRETEAFNHHLRDIARWLTSDDSTFGLYLCGGVGNGKTTMLRALKVLADFVRVGESRNGMYPVPYFVIVSAKELVALAKAYNNQGRDERNDAERYNRLRHAEILAIDDLGTEPRESMYYGEYITAVTDVVSLRYENQLCTLVSSNLAASEIASYYDERIADRFREMMHIVNFGTEQSFRKP